MAYDLASYQQRSNKALDHVKQDIASLRTGKATPQLLDSVVVEAYGSKMKVNEVANVSAPDPTMLTVSPWDKSMLENLEKSIASAGLNLNPVVAGDIIRIVVPPLTEERRKELVKALSQKIENGRVMLRTIRTDIKKEIEDQAGEAGISEDDIHAELDTLETQFKDYIKKLEDIEQQKATELMKV